MSDSDSYSANWFFDCTTQTKGSSLDGVTVPFTVQNVASCMSMTKVFEDCTDFFVVKRTAEGAEFTKKFSSIPTAYAMYSVLSVRSLNTSSSVPMLPRFVTIASSVWPIFI